MILIAHNTVTLPFAATLTVILVLKLANTRHTISAAKAETVAFVLAVIVATTAAPGCKDWVLTQHCDCKDKGSSSFPSLLFLYFITERCTLYRRANTYTAAKQRATLKSPGRGMKIKSGNPYQKSGHKWALQC